MPLKPARTFSTSPYRPVITHSTLRRLLPGFTVSSLGDGMAVVAVSWLAIEIAPAAERGMWVALAAAAYTLSGAVGAVLLGRLLRHRSPARLVVCDALLRATALGAIPVCHALGMLSIELYVVLLATSSLLHSWGQAGVHTLLARLLPERDHLAGNAVLSGIGSLSTVFGPPLAGALILWGGAATVIAVDAATFLVLAATFLFGVPHDAAPAPRESGSRAAGFAVIRRTPALLGLLALSFAFFCLFGPVYVALPLYVSDGLGAPAGLLAAFYTAFGVGAVLGSVLTGYLGRLPMRPAATGIVVAFGLFMLPTGLGAPTAVAVAGFAAAGLLWPPYAALSTALFQRSAPRDLLPRTLAASSAVRVLAVPLGTALGGPLVAGLGARETLLVSAASIAVLGLAAAGAARAWTRRRP
ncbi:MFS transporter [Streptomyces avidinii]|uniref:MFS transporter n=1 Tax=Streptomyces avidinii TaxID=1895 RepID=UPI00386BE136|nr:MFS transporter [Streptomyces avidinii]